MKMFRRTATLITSIIMLLAITADSLDCSAQVIFVGDCPGCDPPNPSTDFNDPDNWSLPAFFPDDALPYLIQDTRTATFSSGDTILGGLTVSNDSFGRLRMTGGSLTLLNQIEALEVGRERFPRGKQGDYDNNGIVSGGDFLVWQRMFGQEVLNEGDGADGDESGFVDGGDLDFWAARYGLVTKGGEVILAGNSTLTTNGAAIGRRSNGLLAVSPNATLNVRGPISTGSSAVRNRDLEVGIYGPAYIAITNEPGLGANGLATVEGTVNANGLTINVFGGQGEFQLLPGGEVNLTGALVLSHCDTQFFPGGCGLISNPEPLMSSKLSIVGSGGSFTVGEHDPDLSPAPGHDPGIRRDIRSEFPSTATMSFTADAEGVTPIVLADNSAFPGEITGTVYLDGTVGNVPGTYAAINLELDLDAYTGISPLTLIDAPPGQLFTGTVFNPEVTFFGSTTATVNYDYVNGDVYLDDFQSLGASSGLLASAAVPEPSTLAMAVTLGLLVCSRSVLGAK